MQAVDSCMQQAVRHPHSRRQDMKTFVYRPIPRLLRYQLLMENVLKRTPEWPIVTFARSRTDLDQLEQGAEEAESRRVRDHLVRVLPGTIS
jgi:hypothetical protein